MVVNDLNTEVTRLYGVGKVRGAIYARMGIYTVGDLLEHYPRGYENRGDVRLLADAPEDSKVAVILTVATEPRVARLKNRMTLLKFKAYDESGFCELIFFNQEYLRTAFPVGSEFRFYGKVQQSKNGYTMSSPAFEPYSAEAELAPLMPVYPLTEGLSQKQIAKDMKSALVIAAYAEAREDPLPEDIRLRHSLCVRSFALRNIHAPDSFSALAAARKRLIFDELLTFALGVSMAGTKAAPERAVPCVDTDISALEARLPYRLTDAQKRVISQIRGDMSRDVAMNRMVVGDVGCGKTVCAAAAIYIAVKNGRQAALMAPTEILATQHFHDLTDMLSGLGVRCELLVGSLSAAAKRNIHAAVAAGEVDVVIGTQALISEGVTLARPGLVVADEQHRFGVGQRAVLAEKNALSHMLVMSATPIPRSLALAMYGNLDVSRIDQMPAGRQRVDTFAVDESYRQRLNGFISKQVEGGGQVYIVCPTVEDKEDEQADLLMGDIDGDGRLAYSAPLKSAVGYAEELGRVFPQYRIAFLHGKMKSAEKDMIMKGFAAGDYDILVSTTVIEVGVNVPNACLMIVENAERFGLSQLHQLRGRVGRGTRKSYCVLVSDAIKNDGKAKDRLLTMKNCYDGFEIAERDLAMRGPGDFLRGNGDETVRQSGGVRFRLAQLCDDASLMREAFDEAKALLSASPDLAEYPRLADEVRRMFTLDKGTIN
ncbi:MAG: ATP-dependent DNA helicase RecG [Clostridia bacterium]|nr:ATP-dependent DNA helicase RecG [Clostridia bacterium]